MGVPSDPLATGRSFSYASPAVGAIAVRDEFTIPYAPIDVFTALRSFEQYPNWWPKKFAVANAPDTRAGTNEAVVFTPAPGIRVGWLLEREQAPALLEFSYHVGPHRGTGRWSLTPAGDLGTNLCLEIEIVPKTLLIGLAYRALRFRQRHSQDIRLLVDALSDLLAKNTRNLPVDD